MSLDQVIHYCIIPGVFTHGHIINYRQYKSKEMHKICNIFVSHISIFVHNFKGVDDHLELPRFSLDERR